MRLHDFAKGERVRVMQIDTSWEFWNSPNMDSLIGKTGIVESMMGSDPSIKFDHGAKWCLPCHCVELVEDESDKPGETMTEFKVGDRFVALKDHKNIKCGGHAGVVRVVINPDCLQVKFDGPVDHDDNICGSSHEWSVDPACIVHEEEAESGEPFEVITKEERDWARRLFLSMECAGRNFDTQLFRLIAKADAGNRARLELGFPLAVRLYAEWHQSPSPELFYLAYGVLRGLEKGSSARRVCQRVCGMEVDVEEEPAKPVKVKKGPVKARKKTQKTREKRSKVGIPIDHDSAAQKGTPGYTWDND